MTNKIAKVQGFTDLKIPDRNDLLNDSYTVSKITDLSNHANRLTCRFTHFPR